jgi:hypothetical protein
MGQPVELRPGAGIDEERQASFLAVDTKVALAVAGLFFCIGECHGAPLESIAMVIQLPARRVEASRIEAYRWLYLGERKAPAIAMRFSTCTNKSRSALADPVFDPTLQMAR